MTEVTLRAGRHASLQTIRVPVQAVHPATATAAAIKSLID